ncbi:hypothetical protein [Streptomyces sp. NPDC048340]|uniref:hypothetical protein n=1 Tax=Streptomyces sp. NPDC048340 TaxID=3365537 RepID=UPI00371177D6
MLQLRAQDVPAADLPEGPDVLQVLWCPREHPELPGRSAHWGPAVEVYRRSAAPVAAVLEPPVPVDAPRRHLPRPCVLDPAGVTDLPDPEDLPAELAARADAWAQAHGTEYHRGLACHDGWKAGGWPSWHSTDPEPLDCSCGARTRLSLTLDSGRDPDLNLGSFGELRIFTCPEDPSHPLLLNLQ